MTSRYRRGDAVTSAPEGEDFHFHGHTVVKRFPPLEVTFASRP